MKGSRLGALALAALAFGCTSDPEMASTEAGSPAGGAIEDSSTRPTSDAAPATDAAPPKDAAPATDAAPPKDAGGGDSASPPPCGRLTMLCADGQTCAGAADCTSQTCSGGLCKTPAPANGVKNGDETDIDCGGASAPACADLRGCLVASDCASSVCTAAICQAPAPTDGVRNGDETGLDCGGAKAPRCGSGQGCASNADCNDLVCDLVQKKCLPPTHGDGIKNDGETGVDCGGPAPNRCPTGQGCGADADCNNVRCDVGATLLCLAATHTDGLKNAGESGTDCGGAAPTKCPTGEGCAAHADCDNVLCDVANTALCLLPTHTDGLRNAGETGTDCGGTAPTKCPAGQGCGADVDCNNVRCNGATLLCDAATKTDGLKNGSETDIDCGGAAPTNAPGCVVGLACGADSDCASTACNYASKCVESRSCKGQHGGDTCGAAGNESCCISLPAGAATIDKFNITAGRMRAFVTATGGNLRGYIAANGPAWWSPTWTGFLPTMLDNGQTSPDDAPAYSGVYQELGPQHHGVTGGGNLGCTISGYGARTYALPDAVNARMGDAQAYGQDVLDERPLNCVTVYMLAAFCAWDGGMLPTRQQLDVAWGPAKYPWGVTAPAGYDTAYADDPKGLLGRKSYGPFQTAPFVSAPFSTVDLGFANYNFNYWGGATQVGTDSSIFIAPPGRFPNGNSATGHADLAGSVFNATDIVGTNVWWSRSGSFAGHTIPQTAAGAWTSLPASNKYWAMGGRCARP